MPVPEAETTTHRWLEKEVLRTRLLDDMESLDHWKTSFWSQGKGEMELTTDRARDGSHSLRLRSATKGVGSSQDGGVFGATSAVRVFDQEDWRQFNRLSFWVYPDLPGFHAVAFAVRLGNQGEKAGRDMNHFLLKNNQWNHVVWEVPDVARESVAEVAFTYEMNGNEPGAAETVTFDIDHLELQEVRADHYEGWNVAPGGIAFSHTGYPTNGPKTAIASDLEADRFQVVSEETGQPAFTAEVRTTQTPIGKFQVMDFTELRTPGTYTIQAGPAKTRPFRIGDDVWQRTIWKALNFFYAERCGAAIPGVHDVCHADWQGQCGDRRIVINGGWHDAGDLSQGLVNTSEAVYAMFALAEKLHRDGKHEPLVERLVDEAQWGLDWVMKTSFPDGSRINWATMRFWTNNTIGDADDVTAKATREPSSNFYAAAAEAIAYRVLSARQSPQAARALTAAEEDWRVGNELLSQRKRDSIDIELASIGVLASVELFKATQKPQYAEAARDLAEIVTGSQQQDFVDGLDVPMTGFFYRTAAHRQIQTYMHRGHEQAPIVALAELCRALPDDAHWMDWYAAVAMHSEYYQKAMARWTAPYDMLPNSLHRVDPGQSPPSGPREQAIRQQITSGFAVGAGHYVRVYPVQPEPTFRGNYGTVLSQTKAVATAARLRDRPELADLCQQQLYWIVGRNPFLQSTMYGEGYDYAPQYTARSGDIVGSLPVGMKSLGNRDLPYWPATNIWNYKEVWVHPVSRWIWLMCDLEGVTPAVDAGSTGPRLDLSISQTAEQDGRVTLTLEVRGEGRHTFTIRSYNLDVDQAVRQLELQPGVPQSIAWQCAIRSAKRPWIAVVVPDGDIEQRIESISP